MDKVVRCIAPRPVYIITLYQLRTGGRKSDENENRFCKPKDARLKQRFGFGFSNKNREDTLVKFCSF